MPIFNHEDLVALKKRRGHGGFISEVVLPTGMMKKTGYRLTGYGSSLFGEEDLELVKAGLATELLWEKGISPEEKIVVVESLREEE